MKQQITNWDKVPDILSKDDFYQLCHISKSTALHLLRSGKVPCEYTGKKTRCYQIRKEDVQKYLEQRAVFPELYSAPQGWYGGHYQSGVLKELPQGTEEEFRTYYTGQIRCRIGMPLLLFAYRLFQYGFDKRSFQGSHGS